MLHLSLIPLVLWGGVLKEAFKVTEYQLAHNQVAVRTAMAHDGRFAVAWVDSISYRDPFIPTEFEVFVRFFDSNGNPVTEAYQVPKLADTNWIYWPCLAMDSAGSAVLLWEEGPYKGYDSNYVRFQLFDKDGHPRGSAQVVLNGFVTDMNPLGLGCNDKGEFAVTWGQRLWTSVGARVWVQRYDADGIFKGVPFLVHEDFAEDYDTHFDRLQTTLSNAGDLVVTWLEGIETTKNYPRFQAFDAEDDPILAWEPSGHRLDDGGPYDGSLSQVHWLDNDRFVVFWVDLKPRWLEGRGFSDRGLTRHPIQNLVNESSDWISAWGYSGGFSSAFSPENRFALTYTRTYKSSIGSYDNQVGVLGEIANKDPVRTTDIFEYSAPLGEDTIWRTPENVTSVPLQPPAVGACNDQIVWVYSRINTDSTCEAFAVLTDWNMGIGIEEPPVVIQSPIRLSTMFNRLSYDLPGEAQLTLYSTDGRRILEETIEGKGTWVAPIGFPSGVYFARVEGENLSARSKVVVVK